MKTLVVFVPIPVLVTSPEGLGWRLTVRAAPVGQARLGRRLAGRRQGARSHRRD